MDPYTGNCTVCPAKCHYSHHVNSCQVIEMVDTSTIEDNATMKAKYVDSRSKKSVFVQIKEGIEKEIKEKTMQQLQVHL